MGDMIDRDAVLERLELAEHDAEERDWRSGANEIARLRKYVAALPAIPAADARAEAHHCPYCHPEGSTDCCGGYCEMKEDENNG